MSKNCYSCGFLNNPDNANCCGKCGKALNYRSYHTIWGRTPDGTDKYRVYDSYSYTCITKSRYNTLCNAEKELNLPLWKQQVNLIKKFWKYFCENLKECLLPLLIVLVSGFVTFAILRGCSSDTKQLSRIKVDNKYGIGYSEKELLIPAEYDSISSAPIGHQWLLYDLSTSLYGIAYVNDTVRNVIPTEFNDITIGGNLVILKKYIGNSQQAFFAVDGVVINKSGYKSITYPGQYLSAANVLVIEDGNNKSFLVDKAGRRLCKDYSRIRVSNDSIIIASDDLKSYRSLHTIFDYEGKKITDKTFTRIRNFSDGVAWCTTTENDARQDRWYIIDNHGNIIYHTFAKYGNVKDFKDGIGWFQKTGDNNGSSRFVAVNKKGRELFEIEAYQVYPYSLGLAPVYKGTSYSNKKLGFINGKGETIIPFKYQAKYSNPEFGIDSLMDVRLDGVEGKLHRNGKFFPK